MTPEEIQAAKEKAAAEQRARNAESRAGAVQGVKNIIKAIGPDWTDQKPAEGPSAADFAATEAATQRRQKDAVKLDQEVAAKVDLEGMQAERATTTDRLRNSMPRPPAAAVAPVPEVDKTKPTNAGSDTTSFTRSGTQLREATLQAEELARSAAYDAAVEKSRIESEYSGLAADLTDTLAQNVQDVNDEVHQLWDAANSRQKQRTQAIENMIDEGRNNMADPTAFFGSNKAAAGFGAGMAVAAGHLAAALGGGPNTALKIIDKAIERQLRADEFNISQATIRDQQSVNLLDKWRQVTKDQVEARTLAKINLIQQAEFAVEAQALRMESELAKSNLAAVKSALLSQKAELMRQHDQLQKHSSSRQIHKLIPLAVQDRDERRAAEAAAAQPTPSAVQTETGTSSALVSALGKRATFDTQADVQTGGPLEQQFDVPASIASPELLQEQGAPLREVSAVEIAQTAYDDAQGNEREKNRASGQAVLDAGREELEALWELGVTDPVELEAAWNQSEVLRETYPDPRDLTPKTRAQEHELGGVTYYEVKDPPKKLTGESYSEGLATIARGNNVLPHLDRLEGEVDDLRRALGGATRRSDGTVDIDRLDQGLRERILDYNHRMNEVFSVVRTMNKSGALQGPGEAQLFRDMSFIPDKIDQITDLLTEGDNMKANLKTQRKLVREFVDISPGLLGIKNSNAMIGDPDDIGARLRANRTQ